MNGVLGAESVTGSCWATTVARTTTGAASIGCVVERGGLGVSSRTRVGLICWGPRASWRPFFTPANNSPTRTDTRVLTGGRGGGRAHARTNTVPRRCSWFPVSVGYRTTQKRVSTFAPEDDAQPRRFIIHTRLYCVKRARARAFQLNDATPLQPKHTLDTVEFLAQSGADCAPHSPSILSSSKRTHALSQTVKSEHRLTLSFVPFITRGATVDYLKIPAEKIVIVVNTTLLLFFAVRNMNNCLMVSTEIELFYFLNSYRFLFYFC